MPALAEICHMNRNDIISAPQVADCNTIYRKWHETHMGSMGDFYRFMTTPSAGRDSFVAVTGIDNRFKGSVLIATLK